MSEAFLRVLCMGTLLLLPSCADDLGFPSQPPLLPASSPAPVSPTPQTSYAAGNKQTEKPAATARSVAEIFPGTGNLVGAPSARQESSAPVTADGDITLNFVNADIRDVAKAVLGDFLKVNYAVGANVQGTVTIETSRPLGRSSVLPVLEQALRLNGMALVKSNDIYKIVPIADAPREAGVSRMSPRRAASEPGFGVEIVPLRYISATEMQRLLEPIAPAQGAVHADATRNILIIQGTEQERAMMLDSVTLFDVDWLSGMSFALFTPQFTDAQSLAKDLNEIIGGGNSPLDGVVRLVPIDRLNAVLAISPRARYLNQLKRWVERLDRPGESTDRRIFVYHVQNGRASDLAGVLTKVLGGGDQQGASVQQQTMPGARPFAGGAIPPGGVTAQPGGLINPSQEDSDPDFSMADGQGLSVNGIGKISITADETNNALVVMGTPREYGIVDAALRQLDTVPLQVMLEAAIAEVTLTNELRYGVQYFYQPNSKHQVVLSNSSTSAIAATFPGFSYAFTDGTDIKIILDALSAITTVNVISSPQVLVLNNQTATLQVGDQVPVATEQAVSVVTPDAPVVNSIQYHDTGVILKVTPRVNQGGMVMMDISQEVSDVAETDTSTIDSPTIQQRKINSTVAVQDNETIALGGLMKDSRTNGKSGVPYLKDIPVLGNLFRSTQNKVTKTELMVLITPHVVDNLQKARTVTEELREKLPAVQPLFEKGR
jgi:general secretion pathway protein D